LKTQPNAVNACIKRSSQCSLSEVVVVVDVVAPVTVVDIIIAASTKK